MTPNFLLAQGLYGGGSIPSESLAYMGEVNISDSYANQNPAINLAGLKFNSVFLVIATNGSIHSDFVGLGQADVNDFVIYMDNGTWNTLKASTNAGAF